MDFLVLGYAGVLTMISFVKLSAEVILFIFSFMQRRRGPAVKMLRYLRKYLSIFTVKKYFTSMFLKQHMICLV